MNTQWEVGKVSIPVFSCDKIATKYCINLSKEETLTILDHDNDIYNTPLVYTLEGIDGVDDVEYDGHFGPHIFLTLDNEHDNTQTWKKIFDVVRSVCYAKK